MASWPVVRLVLLVDMDVLGSLAATLCEAVLHRREFRAEAP